MALIWNAPVGKTADLLEVSGKRELFWYGVTVGQVGFGVLVSRLRQPTKRALDLCVACRENPPVPGRATCSKCVDWSRTSQ